MSVYCDQSWLCGIARLPENFIQTGRGSAKTFHEGAASTVRNAASQTLTSLAAAIKASIPDYPPGINPERDASPDNFTFLSSQPEKWRNGLNPRTARAPFALCSLLFRAYTGLYNPVHVFRNLQLRQSLQGRKTCKTKAFM